MQLFLVIVFFTAATKKKGRGFMDNWHSAMDNLWTARGMSVDNEAANSHPTACPQITHSSVTMPVAHKPTASAVTADITPWIDLQNSLRHALRRSFPFRLPGAFYG